MYFTLIFFVFQIFVTKAYTQNLQLYFRENENKEYLLHNSKHFADTAQLYDYLSAFSAKKQSEAYIKSGYDSIVTNATTIKAYFTLFEKYSVDIDYSSLPFKISKKTKNKTLAYKTISTQVVDYYTNKGYLFVSVSLDNVKANDSVFVAKMNIFPNHKVHIDSLITSTSNIRTSYFERALDLKKGSILSTKKIEKITTRLQNIAFIEQEKPFELAFSENKADIILYLKNKKASTFSGVIGIMPESQTTSKLLITGDVDLSLVNIFRRAETFHLAWKKYDTQNQNLEVNSAFPYLFNSPLGIGANFTLEKKDTAYIKTNAQVKLLIDNSVENRFYIYYRNQTAFSIGKATNTDDFKRNTINLLGLGLSYSMVDYIQNPYKGLQIAATLDVGQKKEELLSSTITQLHSTANYDICGYIGLIQNLTLKLRNCGKYIYCENLRESELVYIGGMQTIRGFDELSLPASYYSLATCELRYLFEKKSTVYALCDFMVFGKKHTANNNFNRALGIGVGVDISTVAGTFSLVYAVGKQNDNHLKINNSKIHFGYKNYF